MEINTARAACLFARNSPRWHCKDFYLAVVVRKAIMMGLVKDAVKLADLLFVALNEKPKESKESYLAKYSYELPFMVRSEFGLDCLINITPGSSRSRLKCVIEGLPEIGMDICEDNLAMFANGVHGLPALDPVKEVYSALRHEILKVTFGRCAAEIRELIDPNSSLNKPSDNIISKIEVHIQEPNSNSMDGDMSVLGGVR